MQKQKSRKPFLSRFRRNEKGAVSVELGLLASMLLMMAIPTVDYGLAFLHHTELKNAIRAGLQYTVVVKPNPQEDEAGLIYVDLTDVKDAVEVTAPSQANVRSRKVSAEMFCRCDETTEVECYDEDGLYSPDCQPGEVARSYVRIELYDEYVFNFPMFGMDETITLGDTQEVRI